MSGKTAEHQAVFWEAHSRKPNQNFFSMKLITTGQDALSSSSHPSISLRGWNRHQPEGCMRKPIES
jgi:hypothetical protein